MSCPTVFTMWSYCATWGTCFLLPAPGSVQPAGGCILSRLQNTRVYIYANSPVPLAPLTSQSRCRCCRDGSTSRCLQGIYSSTCSPYESYLLPLSLATFSSPATALSMTVDQTESSQELRPGHDCRDVGKRDPNE